MESLPPILDVHHLANLLGMTEAGVRAAIARGDLPGRKIGRRWFVRTADLSSLFDSAAVEARERRAEPQFRAISDGVPWSKEELEAAGD